MRICLKFLNYLTFYALWIVCVMGATAKRPFWAIPSVLLYLALHLRFMSPAPRREALFILLLALLGGINESLLALYGVVKYTEVYWLGIGWWTMALWICFATTYWHAFLWLEGRPYLAAVLGWIAAPLCYLWVEGQGGISFPYGDLMGLVVVSCHWAFLLPISFVLSRWIRSMERVE